MKKDAFFNAQRCDACQRDSNIIRQPVELLHPIISLWPFTKWGIDIFGKLPKDPGGKVFMLVMMDYFSKLIEAEAFIHVRAKEIEINKKKFQKFPKLFVLVLLHI